MKKIVAVATGILALTATITGCGTSGNNSNSMTNAGASGTSSSAPVSLDFLQNKPEVVDEWNKLIKEFETQNPNITIKQINPPNTDTALQADLAKGQVPDLIAMGADATFIQMANNGVFKDLSGISELSKVSDSYTKMLEGEVGKSTPYAIPYTVNAVPIIYNVDLLKKYNLTVPTTWNELMADSAKIKAQVALRFTMGLRMRGQPHQYGTPLRPTQRARHFFRT